MLLNLYYMETTMWGKKQPSYFSNNFFKPGSILIHFGTHVLVYFIFFL